MWKKTLIAFALLLLALLLIGIGLVWSIRPTEQLDMSYRRISIASKIQEMIAARNLELRLTDDELNQLLKRELAARKPSVDQVELLGARFEQHGELITAHVQAKLYGLIRAQAAMTFSVKWQPPNLIVEHVGTKAGPWTVPLSRFNLDPIAVALDEELPPLVSIRDVKFEPSAIAVSFKLGK